MTDDAFKKLREEIEGYLRREVNRATTANTSEPSIENAARVHEIRNISEVIRRMLYNAEKREQAQKQ